MEEKEIIKEIQDAESQIQNGYNALIKACSKLGKDTETQLYDLRSIDAVLERYACYFT